MLADYSFIRDVVSPLDAHQLRPLDPKCEVVQFADALADADHKKLAAFLKDYPDIPMRAYAHYGEVTDLDFLRFYPELREFQADLYGLKDLYGLRYLPQDLRFLALG